MDGKTINVRPDKPEEWHWYPPSDPAGMTAKQYAAEIMRSVRKYAKRPEALPHYVREGEIRPSQTRGEGFTLRIMFNQGSGWSGTRQVAAATWLGGNRWTLSGDYRGNAGRALEFLHLPEIDGRLLLVGAPPKPDKGVGKWRDRWTVSREKLTGMIAVAGVGIDPAKIRKDLERTREGALASVSLYLSRAQTARDQLAALPPLEDVLAAGERVKERLALIGLTYDDLREGYASHRTFSTLMQTVSKQRNSDRVSDPRSGAESVKLEAARLLTEHADAESNPMRVGVRATLPDGTPRTRGAFKDPMRIGVPATAPDWSPIAACGNGLHYIPRHTPGGTQSAETCVAYALSYTSQSEFALWIVRAEDPGHPDDIGAVMIDGHKAKAQTLTPLAYCGRYGGGKRSHLRIIATLRAAEVAQAERQQLVYQIQTAERAAASNKALAERTATTLRDWRKG